MVSEAGNHGVENIGIRLDRRMPRNDADLFWRGIMGWPVFWLIVN